MTKWKRTKIFLYVFLPLSMKIYYYHYLASHVIFSCALFCLMDDSLITNWRCFAFTTFLSNFFGDFKIFCIYNLIIILLPLSQLI
ncbi:hypothetical protein J437_LFUL013869 [Ladona fulva]|uniref:Uncharacterized protein n=1 Tax=Ladona fulva TaxID=123851 RepID=A0A8K0KIQ6_LADFU|nr:hypothetical protein J437_LFUL013869 [Ladona fulva]